MRQLYSNGIEGENTIVSHEAANGVDNDLDEEIKHSVVSFKQLSSHTFVENK